MFKRITPDQVEMGMFIHKLEGSWFKHPFWRTRFVLDDSETLIDLRDADIPAVVIDISKGRDVMPPRAAAAPSQSSLPAVAVRPRQVASPLRHDAFDPRSTAPQTLAREFGHAGKIAERGRKIVSKVFLEARLGKTIKADVVEPVIEDIFASIQRNPHAFNGLMRCKRDNEYVFRHALACSALMISLGRQLKLSPRELREAGLAGLLFDVGVNHLPVDLSATGGEFRHLPIAMLAAHTQLGHDFLQASGVDQAVCLVALHHHERNDGSGYPARLIGGDIPLLSRMAAVCDAYDDLASHGSQAADPAAAVQAMATMHGKFDPIVFDAFVQCIGVYPVGAMVRLKSDRLAMVIDQNPDYAARPSVRTFFSLATGESVRGETIDLANCSGADEIVGPAEMARFDPEAVRELRQQLMAKAARATA